MYVGKYWLCLLATVVVTFGYVMGCRKDEGDEGNAASLPERPGWSQAKINARLESAVSQYLADNAETIGDVYGQPELMVAHSLAALSRAREYDGKMHCPPLALLAARGIDFTGCEYLMLLFLNENRETDALCVVGSDESGASVRLMLEWTPEFKDIEPIFVHVIHWPASGENQIVLERDRGEWQRIGVTPDWRVALPSLDGMVLYAAARDRQKGIGNFVRVVDKNLGGKTTSEVTEE
ncbi:MAG: hypothetical protein IPM18_07405 [Phycisphaerales bacterium]|nr:hypothetical protein [Phycisphaerales bacterium]